MKQALKSNIKINFKILKDKFVVFEILLIFIISSFIGYYINSNDPLLFHTGNFNYFYILILILSLFYGMGAGLILLFLYLLFDFLLTKEFLEFFFLNGLMITLISGEFHYYWIKKIESLQSQVNYLDQKLREIGIGASTLKISHDILEKSYLAKPYTIRSILLKISGENDIDNFLKFISTHFFLKKFLFIEYDYKNDKIIKIYSHNSDKKINLDHPMLEKMFFLKEAVYIKDSITNQEKDFLAAIPLFDTKHNIKAFFLIEEISFIHYNIENLLSIQTISEYFLLNREKNSNIEHVSETVSLPISKDAKYEIFKLYQLNRVSHVDSSIFLSKINKEYSGVIENFLEQSLRTLDFFVKLDYTDFSIFLVVLPLVSKSGCIAFAERLFDKFDFMEDKYRYFIFNINEIDSLTKILKDLENSHK